MARNKEGRPEWFKFWRRNRRQLDIEQLGMESRGIVFTNMMRYFDSADAELLPMNPLEGLAFNVVKINVDDSFAEYAEREETNRANGRKGGRPPKTEANPNNPMGFEKTEGTLSKKTEDKGQKKEYKSVLEAAKPQRQRFVPPSLEEVRAYCQSRSSPVDPVAFYEYFETGSWKDAKGQPVRNWKQKLLTWEKHQTQHSAQQSATPAADLSWRKARSFASEDLIEDPPGSGHYRLREEVNADA